MLLDLPTEIVVQILSNLPVIDIVSCRLSCKYLNNVVQESVALKYHMTLIAAKATDNPCSALPLSTKLAQLKNGEKSWAVLKPSFKKTIPVKHNPSGIYDLTGGVYLLGNDNKHDLHFMRLPSHVNEDTRWSTIHVGRTIIDMGLCVFEHDLIAVVTTTPIVATGFGALPTYNIELVLFEFSTGKPHPQAQKHVIQVMNTLWEKPAIGIEIVGDNLVLILFYHRNNAKPDDRVFIYDWRTAVTKTSFSVPYDTYSGLLFLDEHTILLPNTQTNALDIFRIPSEPNFDPDAHIPMMSLGLPRLSDTRTVGGISCRAEPNPIGAASYLDKKKEARDRAAARGDAPLEEDMFPKRGYLANAEHAICIFSLRVLGLQLVNFQFGHSFTFIVHRSALLDIITKWESERDSEKEKEDEIEVQTSGTATNRHDSEENSATDVDIHSAEDTNSDTNGEGSDERLITSTSTNTDSTTDDTDTPNTTTQVNNEPPPRSTPTIKWADWGPVITRWFNSDSIPTRWITTTAGQRCVLIADSAPDTGFPYVVLDFNPESVRRMKRWMKEKKDRDKERERRLVESQERSMRRAGSRTLEMLMAEEDTRNSSHDAGGGDGGGDVGSGGSEAHGGDGGLVDMNAGMMDMNADVEEANEDDNDEWFDVQEDGIEDETENDKEWVIGSDNQDEPTEYHVGLAIVDQNEIPPGETFVFNLGSSDSVPVSTSPPPAFEIVGHVNDPNIHNSITGQSTQANTSSYLPPSSPDQVDGADSETTGLAMDIDSNAEAAVDVNENADTDTGDSELEFHNAQSTTSSIDETEAQVNPLPDNDEVEIEEEDENDISEDQIADDSEEVDINDINAITDAPTGVERDPNNPLDTDNGALRRIWCVTSAETVEPAEIFTEPVEGTLQYMACASAQTYIFHGVLMDEERVIGIRTDFLDRIKQIEVHHFG